jgi:hypothetical protein
MKFIFESNLNFKKLYSIDDKKMGFAITTSGA